MYIVENNRIQRHLDIVDGRLCTAHFHSLLSGADLHPGKNSAEFIIRFTDGNSISSNELTVSEIITDNGRLSFLFDELDGLKASLCYWTEENSSVIRKQLEFTDSKKRKVDCVFLEYFDLENAENIFSVPDDIPGNELNGYRSSLGQPFFADSFFFGSEFPATENGITDGMGSIVYYSGKRKETFTAPVTVVGGAEGSRTCDVRSAFFRYIDEISLPAVFRLQYNSWYDGMLEITEQGILTTFSEVAREIKSHNIPVPDAYTVDDGWNDYKAPFWSFNRKFPTALETASRLTRENGSSLGLWLGPRGGYNSQTAPFARRIGRHGNGAYNRNSHDICVADKTYQKNLKEFLSDTVTRLDLSYLKLDGFCLKPCDSKRHNHAYGGKNGMYMISEMWEGWIDIFKSLRQVRASQGKELWINMTCYVNPSPWWLGYVNSVWLQNSSDIDFSKAYKRQSQVDSEITYRDSRYYEFAEHRKFQFPLCHIYNHEPIYGVSAKVNYTDEEFERYLFFNACRGNALNELHLSCSMMTEKKWEILRKVLTWQKENYGILKNAVFTGGNPEKGSTYAFCSFSEDGRGIVAVRNPADYENEFTFTLDGSIGCSVALNRSRVSCVFGDGFDNNDIYSFGDKMFLKLKPFQTVILSFENSKD